MIEGLYGLGTSPVEDEDQEAKSLVNHVPIGHQAQRRGPELPTHSQDQSFLTVPYAFGFPELA